MLQKYKGTRGENKINKSRKKRCKGIFFYVFMTDNPGPLQIFEHLAGHHCNSFPSGSVLLHIDLTSTKPRLLAKLLCLILCRIISPQSQQFLAWNCGLTISDCIRMGLKKGQVPFNFDWYIDCFYISFSQPLCCCVGSMSAQGEGGAFNTYDKSLNERHFFLAMQC